MACNHMMSILNSKTGKYELVPCGHCINCLAEMQAEWSTRMTMELKSNLNRPAVFVTLTYNDENLPINEVNKDTGEVFQKPSVCKEHIQTFMKVLRTKVDRLIKSGKWKGYKGKLKYFIASEYGPEGGRPHYHGIIYGLSKKDGQLITDVWNKGFCYFGDANEKTIVYTSKYCVKPTELQSNPNRKGYFDNERWMEDNGIRRKPFRLMSTKLGANYCDSPKNLRWHFADIFRHNYLRVGKYKKKLPRYIKLKIYTPENLKKYCSSHIAKKNYYEFKNNLIKNDRKYDNINISDNLVNCLGRSQYYRHLANNITSIKVSESNALADIRSSQERENLLIQTRKKWLRRKERYHFQ